LNRVEPTPRPVHPLAEETGSSALLRDWLRGAGGFRGAAAEWRDYLDAAPTPGPIWRDAAWREPWLAELMDDLPDAAARARAAADVAALAAGRADVVVTGQQPGFLGGPLYTLYKVAAVVAAARARTAAGRATVPLFWSGDDDDDRREAFAPRVFDFHRGALLGAPAPDDDEGAMVGAAPAAVWGRAGAAWLASLGDAEPLAATLAALWREGIREGLTWGRLQRRALLRLFAGTGLLTVSGDDDRLHAAAAGFYDAALPRLAELGAAAGRSGEALVAAGYHAQIGERSLERPLHRRDGRCRLGEPDATPPSDTSALRPGVLLRSPLQDALFRPSGVVAGPGEIAYLEQLRPVYAALDVHRPALLPRLFAHAGTAPPPSAAETSPDEAWIDETLAALRSTLASRCASGPGTVDAHEIERLTGRWRGVLKDLAARREQTPEVLPPRWERPDDAPQERVLATGWAAAVWGEPFVHAALAAAEGHFAQGAGGAWYRWLIPAVAPEPEGNA
jgi:hypothetical protein